MRPPGRRGSRRPLGRVARRIALHALLASFALAWLLPIAWALYTSLRPRAETAELGFLSVARTLSFENYQKAWDLMAFPATMLRTVLIVGPAVAISLGLALFAAFAISRLSWRVNFGALLLMTAANLLPQQALIAPLFRIYLAIPVPPPLSDNGTLYDQALGIVLIHVAMQIGFCTFALSNFMKTLPRDVTESAMLDGASVIRLLRSVIVPMCRAPLAALATLEIGWVYNDLYWALFLMRTGDKRPVTSALAGLQGEFFRDTNALAAAAILVAIPPLIAALAFQRRLVGGLASRAGES